MAGYTCKLGSQQAGMLRENLQQSYTEDKTVIACLCCVGEKRIIRNSRTPTTVIKKMDKTN